MKSSIGQRNILQRKVPSLEREAIWRDNLRNSPTQVPGHLTPPGDNVSFSQEAGGMERLDCWFWFLSTALLSLAAASQSQPLYCSKSQRLRLLAVLHFYQKYIEMCPSVSQMRWENYEWLSPRANNLLPERK